MKNTNFKIFNMHILSVKMKNPHMINNIIFDIILYRYLLNYYYYYIVNR